MHRSTRQRRLPYKQFQEAIEKPLKEYLQQDSKIDFIVLNKGIPIRLTDAPIGLSLKQPSLDSYLAALDYFDRTDVLTVEIDDSGYRGRCFVNRYWNAKEPFQHAKFGGYLVARLDGYSLESAKGLVDSALMAEPPSQQVPSCWMLWRPRISVTLPRFHWNLHPMERPI